MARRARPTLSAHRGVGGGAYGRDLVEHRFGLDVSVRAVAAADLRLSQGRGDAGDLTAESDVRGRAGQRRCGGISRLHTGSEILGAPAAEGDQAHDYQTGRHAI